jgi:hypothetical protein
MSLTLAAVLVGGYLLTLVIVLVFVISLGRAAKVADEQEAKRRRAEGSRRRRRGGPTIRSGHPASGVLASSTGERHMRRPLV